MRSYAGDAASDLRSRIHQIGLTAEEIDYCVREISTPERISNGSSKWLLVRLGEEGHPLLVALANSGDARLRLFALEAADSGSAKWNNYKPLCTLIAKAPHLLDDPDDDVRLAAASSSDWMWSNIHFLKWRVQDDSDHIVVRLYYKFLTLLNDSSSKVRAAAAKALGCWAAEVAHDALVARLERENDPDVRHALAAAIAAKQRMGVDSPEFTDTSA